MKYKHTLWAKIQIFNFKTGGTDYNHLALNVYVLKMYLKHLYEEISDVQNI
jgi:hypothetical protein